MKKRGSERGRSNEKGGIFSLQDLRRPSIDERVSSALEGLSSLNRWKIVGDAREGRVRGCPLYLFSCLGSFSRSAARRGAAGAGERSSASARAGLIFKVPDERNDRETHVSLVLDFTRRDY